MEIEKVREEKLALEKEIERLIDNFCLENGIIVCDILHAKSSVLAVGGCKLN